MARRLTREERALWDRLRESVTPLRPQRATESVQAKETAFAEAAGAPPRARPAEPGAPRRTTPPATRLAPADPLARFETRTLRRIARGLVEIDARIDLHGMRQERAFQTLSAFLRRQQAAGARIVLIVTGKGRAEGEGRGVLRASVPGWLAGDALRPFVSGFEEAHRRHGGAGALYVRIRRRRARAGEAG